MKVILMKDVPKVGKKFEVKSVADGFAINSLIPQQLAEVATPNALARLAKMKAESETEKKIQENLLLKDLSAIKGQTINILERANEKGHLFAQVHKAEIVKILKDNLQVGFLPENVLLDRPIKEVGKFQVAIAVGEKKAEFTLEVNAQK